MNYVYLKQKVLRIIGKKVYFFNEEGIYTEISVSEARKLKMEGLEFNRKTGEYFQNNERMIFTISGQFYGHYIMTRAVACLEKGDTIERLKHLVEKFKKMYVAPKNFKITDTVLRVCSKKYYYFNKDGKYSCMSEKEILNSDIYIDGFIFGENGQVRCYCDHELDLLCRALNISENKVMAKMAIAKMNIGDEVQDLVKYYNNVSFEEHKIEEIDRFITRIDNPNFVCVPENPNKNTTFDFIHMYVGIVSEWDVDRVEYIKQNIGEIDKKVINKLKKNSSFLKYGVPVNVLKLSKRTIVLRRSELHYVFELKKFI